MGAVPSTPRNCSALPQDIEEHLIGTFVGEKSLPLTSDYWQKLLELPLNLHWPTHLVRQACEVCAQNNYYTRHLAKILMHLAWCLQESASTCGLPSSAFMKAVNAIYISSVFLKYLIENAKSNAVKDLYLSLDEHEAISNQSIESFVMHSVLSFIGKVDVSPNTYVIHRELLSFTLVSMSTQLLSGPSPGPKDIHSFIDAAMVQESSLVGLVVHKLLNNYITRPHFPINSAYYTIFSKGDQPGVLQRELQRPVKDGSGDSAIPDSFPKENAYFSENPYSKALETAKDVESLGCVDIEGNAHNGSLVRLPFASLFDTLGMCLADETSVLLLYSLVHGNSNFLEFVLMRTDIDTLLMPMLDTLYNASRRTSNQIYMLLIILLILSQDSSFNASIHKMMLPSVPWYQERLLHQTSLGSLVVIVLIRTVKYNLSKLRDVYLHTNCLATLANMAPHVHHLSPYASQRLVSLFDMLSRKYTKLAVLKNDKMHIGSSESGQEDSLPEDMTMELHIFTDFLRIVLEILNAILTNALPRNPEVVYAIMHRQEVFQPFKNHPRFNELLENIFTVLDFFNSRIDAQRMDSEWSVENVLQVIIINCRSWRGEGMKMFTQLHFTYEQESHPEEFFIPYMWQLVLSCCGINFNPSSINLFPINLPVEEDSYMGEEAKKQQSGVLDG